MLASDGMWDVLSDDFIRQIAMHVSHRDPKDLAVYLAYEAKKQRKTRQMTDDDITVIVVDVNPNRAIFVGKKYMQLSSHFRPSKAARSVSSESSHKEVLHLRNKLTKSYTAVAEGPLQGPLDGPPEWPPEWPGSPRKFSKEQALQKFSEESIVMQYKEASGKTYSMQSYSIKEESKCCIQ